MHTVSGRRESGRGWVRGRRRMPTGLSARRRDAGMSEGVLIMAVSHQQQQAEPSRQGRSLLGGTLPGKNPDHRPCTAIQRELRKVIWRARFTFHFRELSRRTEQNGHG